MKILNYELKGTPLAIYTYPEPVLLQKSKPVVKFDQELKTTVFNMLYTMYHAPGIGLAAPQVGINQRFFVVDVDFEREEKENEDGSKEIVFTNLNPQVFINPTFSKPEGKILFKEGCLSVPDIYEEVQRCEKIVVDYQDLDGNKHTLEADDILAICLQHENDHLDGIVFIDRLSALKKNFFRKKLIKEKKRM
jgi:peptide deformylase